MMVHLIVVVVIYCIRFKRRCDNKGEINPHYVAVDDQMLVEVALAKVV